MASKGNQSGRRGSSMDEGSKRGAPTRSGKAAQSAGSHSGSQGSRTRSGSSGRKNTSHTDR